MIRRKRTKPQVRKERPQEMPAVRTTIVGGRPPGCGKAIGDIPRGVEVLVKKAAVDPAFRLLLLTRRAAAADEIGLRLEPAEARMLNHVPAGHIEAIIDRTTVDSSRRPAFLGKVAGVMLAALGASAGGNLLGADRSAGATATSAPTTASAPAEAGNAGAPMGGNSAGVRPQPMTQPVPTTQPVRPDQLRPVRGIMALPPVPVAGATVVVPRPPTTRPARQPASQPATRPALSDKEIRDLLRQLDDDKYAVRQAAHNKLQGQGIAILPALREALRDQTLSTEVRMRLESIVTKLTATTQPAPPDRPMISIGIRVIAGAIILND